VLLSVLYHLTIKHDHEVSQSAARRQFLLANVLPTIKQRLLNIITSALNQVTLLIGQAGRQFLLANVLPTIKQRLLNIITSALNQVTLLIGQTG
jgi:hypothetical protein